MNAVAENIHQSAGKMVPRRGMQESFSTALQRTGEDPDGVRSRFARYKLGEIMVMMGMITREKRDIVVGRQHRIKLQFGACCLRMKLITEEELTRALGLQFGFLHPVVGRFTFSKDLVVAHQPFGKYAEVVREVCSRLLFSWASNGRNALAVTSTQRKEGRSHVAANLAVAFAQMGCKTLLLDADLRNPRQHTIFDLPLHPGLSRLLCGYAPDEVAYSVDSLKNLTLITAGPEPPNPLELIGRSQLPSVMQYLRDHYDLVIVDTPCGSQYMDSELIASATGSALMVALENHSRVGKVRTFSQRLIGNGVCLAGTLMNTR
ncbi:MAG: polysaccharide biosynthesis tyrosine autokinase [Chromatiales bacterium]|nr:polysaccharide biosynthesis tyrosine autokinase [Chromatiales bacterium]